ncbi:hypothetical protein FKP32DRAFT_1599814, partial [Trametes sanguinea]
YAQSELTIRPVLPGREEKRDCASLGAVAGFLSPSHLAVHLLLKPQRRAIMEQPSRRVVLWTEDFKPATVRMVPLDANWQLALCDMSGLPVEAFEGMLAWDIRRGEWSPSTGGAVGPLSSAVALLRLERVNYCAGFGSEVDLWYQMYPRGEQPSGETNHGVGVTNAVQSVRVHFWFSVTEIQQGLCDVWDVTATAWSRHSIWKPLDIGNATILLVKCIDVGFTPGFGQLVSAMEGRMRLTERQPTSRVKASQLARNLNCMLKPLQTRASRSAHGKVKSEPVPAASTPSAGSSKAQSSRPAKLGQRKKPNSDIEVTDDITLRKRKRALGEKAREEYERRLKMAKKWPIIDLTLDD